MVATDSVNWEALAVLHLRGKFPSCQRNSNGDKREASRKMERAGRFVLSDAATGPTSGGTAVTTTRLLSDICHLEIKNLFTHFAREFHTATTLRCFRQSHSANQSRHLSRK